MRRLLTVLVMGCALVGCGSSTDSDEGPDSTDPQVTKEDREAVTSAARTYLENDDPAKCAGIALDTNQEACRKHARKPAKEPKLEEPEIVEATAHVAYTADGSKGELTLRSDGSSWKVEKAG